MLVLPEVSYWLGVFQLYQYSDPGIPLVSGKMSIFLSGDVFLTVISILTPVPSVDRALVYFSLPPKYRPSNRPLGGLVRCNPLLTGKWPGQ